LYSKEDFLLPGLFLETSITSLSDFHMLVFKTHFLSIKRPFCVQVLINNSKNLFEIQHQHKDHETMIPGSFSLMWNYKPGGKHLFIFGIKLVCSR
jgi:hypothetical protein